jgi:hypothetical protein
MTLSDTEKQELLALSRRVLDSFVKTGAAAEEDCSDANYLQSAGVFVTLKKGDELRGCIGFIEPVASIWDGIVENTIAAASTDPRFAAVAEEELPEITIEISILTKSKECSLEEIEIGKDGVVLQQGVKKATYLPQVWETFKTKEEFMPSLCEKAGLESDCYTQSNTKFYKYQATAFSE